MSRTSEYTYDPKTGKWSKSTTDSSSNSSNTKKNTSKKNTSNKNKNNSKKSGDNLTSSNSDKNNSTGSVEKKYNTIELNTLNGTLSFIVTEETIKLVAGDTVKLEGLGKYLSGDYYIKDITRQISSSGYSHSATLIKTDFGSSLKVSNSTSTKKSKDTTTTKKKVTKKKTQKKVKSSTQASSAKRKYTVKKGDCLWNIAKKYYGSGAQYTKIYNANKDKIKNPNLIYVGQVFIIP